jgi:SAM-dependent methyltransferase
MVNRIKKIYNTQLFQPNFFGLFVNPCYLIRKGLFQNIKNLASQLEGDLLDFGCGSKPYINLFKVNSYTGVDIEISGHAHFNSKVDIYYDGKTLPFENESFSAIFTSEVFEHIFNLDEILSELNRVLKPEGKILLTTPFVWEEHEQPYDYARYTSFAMIHLLKKHKFEVIQLHKTNNQIEAIFQSLISYFSNLVKKKSYFQKAFSMIIIIFPLTILGLLLSNILPKRYEMYSNLVILAKKIPQ